MKIYDALEINTVQAGKGIPTHIAPEPLLGVKAKVFKKDIYALRHSFMLDAKLRCTSN